MKLELFKFDTCPFCQKVLRYLGKSGRNDVALSDIRQDPAARRRLIEIGGKEQVPCLFIDDAPLYESADIIAWLEQHPHSDDEQ